MPSTQEQPHSSDTELELIGIAEAARKVKVSPDTLARRDRRG